MQFTIEGKLQLKAAYNLKNTVVSTTKNCFQETTANNTSQESFCSIRRK